MRIISGTAGGRRMLNMPEDLDVRPTSDMVRGAVFNSLRNRMPIENSIVLDCFCGTGALGLEALSQGAASCAFIDNNKKALAFAKENAAHLKLEKGASYMFANVEKLKERPAKQPPATLAFLDPPYEEALIWPSLGALHNGAWLEKDAICIVEVETIFSNQVPPVFRILDQKVYDDTKILFLIHMSESEAV